MAEAAPVPGWAETLRADLARRRSRRRRVRVLTVVSAGLALLAVPAAGRIPVLLVWNASASEPVGLYRVERGGPVRTGDMVIATVPESVRSLAAVRRYLPAGVPLVKRAAAVEGDRVCAEGRRITVDDRVGAIRSTRDSAGRPMPWWEGCRVLRHREILLLGDSRQSFDGRYFGITPERDIIGRARLLWPR